MPLDREVSGVLASVILQAHVARSAGVEGGEGDALEDGIYAWIESKHDFSSTAF
jgi:hypothetical protein